MKFIANTFFLAIIWRRYQRLIVAVVLLFVSYFLISLLHDDYLDYVKNSGNDAYLGFSYAVKWAILLLATIAFYVLIVMRSTRKDAPKEAKPDKPNRRNEKNTASNGQPDPFDAIRHKKKLRGRADQFLEDGET